MGLTADEIENDFKENEDCTWWDDSLSKDSTREEIEDYLYNSDMLN